ncbi:nicotinate-nucleotide adenylyltransferase [Luteimonas kalidii]|uniref:Probable nicotinate-nucleotide adenylyltransferase n=1 Tax=Luteimonas kalidii TaxID=3042025 RepID=A0ABT6JYB3_9GAMM|nr:nicotinate-nucleotide adenylyltransferase [Luteimonas kalidii]MDH5835684.1 nicotinate-nucleotide adenylyltransferase [Luteimonas kalidii]
MTGPGSAPAAVCGGGETTGGLHVFYGGTFDPVHHGHLAVARGARAVLDCPIRLMPAADPPHRAPPGASAGQRARMLALAIDGEPGLLLDERELHRDGPSYSVDTLRELRRELGETTPIALLVGADSLLGLPTWHAWTTLTALTHFVVADRPGSRLDARLPAALAAHLAGRWTDDPSALRAAPAGRVLCLRQPLHPGSATRIRRRIAAGEAWRDLVPVPVADYIVRHRLYGVHGPQTAGSL